MRHFRILAVAALVLVVAAAIVGAAVTRGPGTGTTGDTGDAAGFTLGTRTKTDGCLIAAAMPDPACTPGAVFSGVSREQVCARGYSRTVRNVTEEVKAQVYIEYGLPPRPPKAGAYEVDHLVSLELGGSNDIANLWPEAASPRPGFHEKDRLENYLHDQVCSGNLSLFEAQRRIAVSWVQSWENAGLP